MVGLRFELGQMPNVWVSSIPEGLLLLLSHPLASPTPAHHIPSHPSEQVSSNSLAVVLLAIKEKP